MRCTPFLIASFFCAFGSSVFAQDKPVPPVTAPTEKPTAPETVKEAIIPAPSPEAIAQGKAMLAATIKAHGGDAFLGVKTLKAVGRGVATGPEEAGELEIPLDSLAIYISTPDKARLEMETGFGSIVAGKSGSKIGWVMIGGQVQNNPNDYGVSLIPVTVLVQAVKDNYTVAALPDNKIALTADGKKLAGFVVTDKKGREIRLYSEEGRNLLRRVEQKIPSGMSSLEMGDYKTVQGTLLPGSIQLKQKGKTVLSLTLTGFEVNNKLEDVLFERPVAEKTEKTP